MPRWTWLLAFLALTLVGDRAMAYVLRSGLERSEFRYSRLYTGRAEADLVFIGNSRGLNFYQPYIEAATGRKTLNLSYNALPVDLSTVLLADYLERYGPPRDLVVEITHLDRANPDLVREFRAYAPYSERMDQLQH